MNNETPMVVACIDGSKYSKAVCDYAAWISLRVNVPLKLLHNIEHRETPPADLSGAIGLGSQEHLLNELIELEQQRGKLELERGKLMLAAAKERVVHAGVEDPVLRQRHGSLTESLVDCEAEIRVLVLGIRGEEHENDPQRLGNQLENIARSLHRPIMVVNRDFTPPKRIMLAYDGSDGARKALDMIAKSPLFKGLPCHIVHVSEEEASSDNMLNEAEEILQSVGMDVTTARLTGKTGDALCAYQAQHEIDLTLMGAFGHTRFRELLLGSFTAKMLLTTRQPLLLLR